MIGLYSTWLHVKTGKCYVVMKVCQFSSTGGEVIFLQPEDDACAEVKVWTKHLFLNGGFELKRKGERLLVHFFPGDAAARLMRMITAKNVYLKTHRSDGSVIHPYAPDGGALRAVHFHGTIR